MEDVHPSILAAVQAKGYRGLKVVSRGSSGQLPGLSYFDTTTASSFISSIVETFPQLLRTNPLAAVVVEDDREATDCLARPASLSRFILDNFPMNDSLALTMVVAKTSADEYWMAPDSTRALISFGV